MKKTQVEMNAAYREKAGLKTITFTISEKLINEFKDKCKSNGETQKEVLEKLMGGYLK